MAAVVSVGVISSSPVYLVVCLTLTTPTSVCCDQLPGVRCAWDEYYDENMDDCGPCGEICDNRRLTRTEAQCQSQCSDYLVSMSCRVDQYFDEVVKSCTPCVDLCSQRDARGTTKECFQKCRDFMDTNKPSNIVDDVGKDMESSQDSSSSTSSFISSWLPTVIAIGGVASVAAIGLIIYYRNRNMHRLANYVQAPRNEVIEPRAAAATRGGELGRGRPVVIEMVNIRPGIPIQVSSEQMTAEDICIKQQTTSAGELADSEATLPKTVLLGMAECDPVAPSSAAALHVHRQQSS